jgi:hypothetical protein
MKLRITELQDRVRNLTYDVRFNLLALKTITKRQIVILYDLKLNLTKIMSLTSLIGEDYEHT